MNKDLKSILVKTTIGLAAVTAVFLTYRVIATAKRKNKSNSDDKGKTVPESNPDKQEAPKRKGSTDTKTVKGKKAYAKVADVSLRSKAYVNNGFINNILFTANKGELIGTVTQVVNDTENAKRPDGKVWEWYKIEINPPKVVPGFIGATSVAEGYVREDVVNLK